MEAAARASAGRGKEFSATDFINAEWADSLGHRISRPSAQSLYSAKWPAPQALIAHRPGPSISVVAEVSPPARRRTIFRHASQSRVLAKAQRVTSFQVLAIVFT